ncbi:MAG TPA: hypothetical protein VFZ61_27325 [Polyangiales bacterium]
MATLLWLSAAVGDAQAAPTTAPSAPASAPDQPEPALSTQVAQPARAQPLAPPQPAEPAPPPSPAKPPIVRAYGILWATLMLTQPVQSYGHATATAPTSAASPGLYAHPDNTLLTFQVQQTRAGLVVGEGTPVRGTLEVDFIHFDQSSPLAQAFPRIRVALIEWNIVKTQKVFAGQTWDIFGDATGPQLLSHSFNLVGSLFQAGNIGFMRQQFGWAGSFGNWELSAAAGLQGANTGPTFNNIEEARVPTGAGRVMYHLPGALGVVGVSGIGTALRFKNGSSHQQRAAGGAELFADITVGPLNLHSEIYFTQNLANTGALNLAQGRYGQDVRDAGGYVSGKLTFGQHAVTAMYGYAAVLNPSDLVPGYTPASMGATPVAAVATPGAGPGMRYNMTGHVAYWYSPLKGLSIVLEPYVYATRFRLAEVDVGRVPSRNVSWGAMFGSMYQF